MRAIIRKLLGERTGKYKSDKANKVFSPDISTKILRLFNKYNANNGSRFELGFEPKIATIPLFLERLSFHIPEGTINNLHDLSPLVKFLFNCDLSKYLDVLELHAHTLFEISSRLNQSQYFGEYIVEFNNLMAVYGIPFNLVFNEKLNQTHIEEINSEMEEKNKKAVYTIIEGNPKINEYFTNALNKYAKKEFPESIDLFYLTLEQYLKEKTGNSKLDASKNYAEFRKKYSKNYKGIFKVRTKIIEDKIDTIYGIRSEIKAHSPKGTFNTDEFLEETARFQLNEVMTCIILLEQLTGSR